VKHWEQWTQRPASLHPMDDVPAPAGTAGATSQASPQA